MHSSTQKEKTDFLNSSQNNESLSKIKNLLTNIIQKQNENTIIKKQLFSYKGFYPEILFLKLDYFSKKNITTLDFLHYLDQHQYKFNDEIIRRFIKQYDKHGNFNLIYEDFTNMILPFDNNFEKNNSEKAGEVQDEERDTDEIFCEILINELKLIGLIGDLIIDIRKLDEYNTYKIFEIISNKEQYLNGEKIFNFLEGKYNTEEINRLVYYLDSNNDGLITYDDFQDLLLPIKGDFEDDEYNSEYIFSECYEENMNYPLLSGIYNNYRNNYTTNSNLETNSMYNINNNRNTYFINYKINSRNKIPNIKKNQLNFMNHKSQIKTEKDLISLKYLNYSMPIHEQNETYENPTTNEENIKNDNNNQNINKEEEDINNNNNIDNISKEINQEQEIKNNDINKDETSDIKNEQNVFTIKDENDSIIKEENINEKNDNKINNSIDDINIKEKNIENNSNNDIIITDRNNNKENINDGVSLQKFPNTFGKNQDNDTSSKKDNKNDNVQNINENIDYINQKNSDNKLIKKIIPNNQNHKTKKNIHKKNIINNNINNIQNKSFHIKSKLNLESNINQYNDIIPSNTYNFPLIEDRNINLNIKSNNKIYNDYSNIIDDMSIFFEYINSIIYYENRFEHIKESLALREDLSMKEIFYLFDKHKVKHITIDNFQLICKKVFKIFPTKDQIKLVFKRYKKDLNINTNNANNKNNKQDYSLSQDEFMLMLNPKKSEYMSIIANKNKMDKSNSKLSKKSKNILIELIKCLILKESNYYKIRCQLEQNSLEYIWKEIYKYSTFGESINKTQFNQFLEEYGYFFGQKQLDIIFSIFDKDKKDLIKDIDFFEEMCCE